MSTDYIQPMPDLPARLRDERHCNNWYMRQEAANEIDRLEYALATAEQRADDTRRLTVEECISVADKVGDRLMKKAKKYHDAEEPNYDAYEAMECQAGVAGEVVAELRKLLKKKRALKSEAGTDSGERP